MGLPKSYLFGKVLTYLGGLLGRQVKPGVNDLRTIAPRLVDEWDFDKNVIDPGEVSAGSNKKFWWKCLEYGHSWEAPPGRRVGSGTGCRVCGGQEILRGFNDLATTHPDIADQLVEVVDHPELDKYSISGNSGRAAKWKCSTCTFIWTAKVYSRAGKNQKNKCPSCSGHKVAKGINDFAQAYPELLSEWDYNKNDKHPSEYTPGSGYKVWWICSSGHSYECILGSRTNLGVGCPKCSHKISKNEQTIFDSLRDAVKDLTQSDRKELKGPELDIYSPSLKTGIEFNGLYWHSEKYKSNTYHHNKYLLAKESGIRLIQVWEDDWVRNPELVLRMLKHKLGVSDEKVVYARETEVVSLGAGEIKKFLDENHIQGSGTGSIRLGLKDKKTGELVAAMVLKKTGDELELVRYATSCRVPGGQSKLLKWVDQNVDYKIMKTFADLTLSDGSLYEVTGWRFDKLLKPDYSYLVSGQRVHKFNYRLKRFRDDPDLEYVEGMTERQLAQLNGLLRVYDAGKIRYERTNPKYDSPGH